MKSAKAEPSWRALSDVILKEIVSVSQDERLAYLQEKLLTLPEGSREMVAHFVSVALLIQSSDNQRMTSVSRHTHISYVTAMALIATIVLAVAGLYLVTLHGDDAPSKISIFGATVETSSVGVACLALAAFTFLFVARKALSRL
ncbi:hypothetical protein X743_29760 [Mesorhizobium sp. LNHC252B00]|nr:hypothetical protein X743_29760 [Mesorhizobium sp. LNHC252B00]